MMQKMNKKGIFFTLLAIAILSLFLMSYTFYSSAQKREVIQKRVSTLNNFVFSVEKDLPRQLYISGFRIIFLFEKRIAETGDYIDNVTLRFNETFFNGTFYGASGGDITTLMGDATFLAINEKLQENAASINAIANLANPSLIIIQEDPWSIKVTLTADLSIKDNTNLVSWNRTANITVYVPIENFEDPLYMKGTHGLVANKINKTIYSVPIPLSNLLSQAENSYYINSTDAPSFLKRLQGDFSADQNGIESLVNIPQLSALSAQGITVQDKCVIDHIYFSTSNPSTIIPTGMPSWLKIANDGIHTGLYQIS